MNEITKRRWTTVGLVASLITGFVAAALLILAISLFGDKTFASATEMHADCQTETWVTYDEAGASHWAMVEYEVVAYCGHEPTIPRTDEDWLGPIWVEPLPVPVVEGPDIPECDQGQEAWPTPEGYICGPADPACVDMPGVNECPDESLQLPEVAPYVEDAPVQEQLAATGSGFEGGGWGIVGTVIVVLMGAILAGAIRGRR